MKNKHLSTPWSYLVHIEKEEEQQEQQAYVINFKRGRGDSKEHMINLTLHLDDARVWKTKRQKDMFIKKWADTGLLNHCYWIEL